MTTTMPGAVMKWESMFDIIFSEQPKSERKQVVFSEEEKALRKREDVLVQKALSECIEANKRILLIYDKMLLDIKLCEWQDTLLKERDGFIDRLFDIMQQSIDMDIVFCVR